MSYPPHLQGGDDGGSETGRLGGLHRGAVTADGAPAGRRKGGRAIAVGGQGSTVVSRPIWAHISYSSKYFKITLQCYYAFYIK